MRIHRVTVAAALASMLITAPLAHEVEEGKGTLGKVSFANSCDTKVQGELQGAVAMLHSFWFSAGERPSAMCSRTIRHAPWPRSALQRS